MTLQPPRRTWIKNALIVIAIILVLAGLGGLIAYFIKGSDDGRKHLQIDATFPLWDRGVN